MKSAQNMVLLVHRAKAQVMIYDTVEDSRPEPQ